MSALATDVRDLEGFEIEAVSGAGLIEDIGAAIGGALGSRGGAWGAAAGAVVGGAIGRAVESTDGAAISKGIGESPLRDRVGSGV